MKPTIFIASVFLSAATYAGLASAAGQPQVFRFPLSQENQAEPDDQPGLSSPQSQEIYEGLLKRAKQGADAPVPSAANEGPNPAVAAKRSRSGSDSTPEPAPLEPLQREDFKALAELTVPEPNLTSPSQAVGSDHDARSDTPVEQREGPAGKTGKPAVGVRRIANIEAQLGDLWMHMDRVRRDVAAASKPAPAARKPVAPLAKLEAPGPVVQQVPEHIEKPEWLSDIEVAMPALMASYKRRADSLDYRLKIINRSQLKALNEMSDDIAKFNAKNKAVRGRLSSNERALKQGALASQALAGKLADSNDRAKRENTRLAQQIEQVSEQAQSHLARIDADIANKEVLAVRGVQSLLELQEERVKMDLVLVDDRMDSMNARLQDISIAGQKRSGMLASSATQAQLDALEARFSAKLESVRQTYSARIEALEVGLKAAKSGQGPGTMRVLYDPTRSQKKVDGYSFSAVVSQVRAPAPAHRVSLSAAGTR